MYRNRLTAMAVTVPKNTVAKVLWKNPWIRHRKGNEPRPANKVFTLENCNNYDFKCWYSLQLQTPS